MRGRTLAIVVMITFSIAPGFGIGSLLCSAFAQEEAGSAAPATVPEDASWETPLKTIPLAPEKPAALPAQDPERRPSGIEEIVVTARRVNESLQEVPVAISAMSADDLKREQINSTQDLQDKVDRKRTRLNSSN